MRELDQRAVNEFGISIETLMDNAGIAVADEALRFLESNGPPKPWEILVLCGSGNNAGDGLAAALSLSQANVHVRVTFLKPINKLSGAALILFQKLLKTETPCDEALDGSLNLNRNYDVIIDAILGTGFEGNVVGLLAQAIEAVNRSGFPVLAVDLPSGMNCDTGTVGGACIEAKKTVTLVAMKKGFLNPEALKWTGDIVVRDIGFPKEIFITKTKAGG